MKPESIEDLRRRLLEDEIVREMISRRAYEIYQMRGSQPGQDAENWFRAENEILTFLIQEESRREAYLHEEGSGDEFVEPRSKSDLSEHVWPSEEGGARPQVFEPRTTSEIAGRHEEPTAQLADEKADSRSALGVWSTAEPASAEPAPPIGKSAEQTQAPAEKKTRSRSPSKSAEPRKRKTTTSSSKKGVAKEGVAKDGVAKKPATRRATPKKSTEGK